MGNDWPHDRAFVLQLGPQADPASGRIEGRIEHVASLRAARFCSLVELVAFLMDVCDQGEQESDDGRQQSASIDLCP